MYECPYIKVLGIETLKFMFKKVFKWLTSSLVQFQHSSMVMFLCLKHLCVDIYM